QLLIIDLKDCFFSIPLHPEDTERFAFSVPQTNVALPAKRYEWVVLPQGMKNSPTMCQWYVSLALDDWRKENPDPIVYHYMDDILIATPKGITEQQEEQLKQCL
ncbi:POK8 protein, partial [Alcedo cyanopectus]|nr:POK8 protein [Ceyx cyanopectus]